MTPAKLAAAHQPATGNSVTWNGRSPSDLGSVGARADHRTGEIETLRFKVAAAQHDFALSCSLPKNWLAQITELRVTTTKLDLGRPQK